MKSIYLDLDSGNRGDLKKRTGGSFTWNHGGSKIGHGTQ